VPCRAGWHGKQESHTNLTSCEPCPPNFLQPLRGQASCLPCPPRGVDCTVQDRIAVLPGWFLASSGDATVQTTTTTTTTTTVTVGIVVAGSIDAFDAVAFEASLRRHVVCEAPECTVTLETAAGSVHINATVSDTTADGAATDGTLRLRELTTSELTDALGMDVEAEAIVLARSVEDETDAAAAFTIGHQSLSLTLCPQRDSCLGGDNSSCAAGHAGPLCGLCVEGFYQSRDGCAACSADAATTIAIYGSGAVLAALLAFVYMAAQLSRRQDRRAADSAATAASADSTAASAAGADDDRKRRGPLATLLSLIAHRARSAGTIGKILLAYFQVLHTFSQLPSIAWPPLFERYLAHLAVFSFQVFSAYPLSCVLDIHVDFEVELLAVLLLPIGGALLVLLLAWLAAQCTLPKQERGLRAVATRAETTTLQLWLMLLLYPSLAKTALMPFDCVTVGGRSLLRANPAVECSGASYGKLVAIGVIGTVVYSFGFPLLCFVVSRAAHRVSLVAQLAANADAATAAKPSTAATATRPPAASASKPISSVRRVKASTSASASAPTSSSSAGGGGDAASAGSSVPTSGGRGRRGSGGTLSADVATATGRFARARLLLRSYRPGFWWFESAEVLRKYFLTSVVLVVQHDSLLQVYLGLLVCVAAALLVARHQPYESPFCGKLQMLALTQLAFTYMSGMLFFDDGSSGGGGGGGSGGGGGGGAGSGTRGTRKVDDAAWGVALVLVNLLVLLGLAVGLCGAVGGAALEAGDELRARREREAALREEISALRATLASPPEEMRRAQISLDEIELSAQLGEGAFGTVHAATWKGTPVAVKRLHAHHRSGGQAAARAQAFRDEVLLLLELRHPNIVQLIGGSWDVDSGEMCLVLELCERSLESLLLDTSTRLRWVEHLLPLATGIARGMAYLHAQEPPIVHRDLKPANVLLGTDMTVGKIADLGTALEMAEGVEVAGSGSPLFQAPEVLRREEADTRCDVWAYGCILVCLSTRDANPYAPTAPVAAVRMVTALQAAPLPPRASPVAQILEECTTLDFELRPCFEDVVDSLEEAATIARARATDADEYGGEAEGGEHAGGDDGGHGSDDDGGSEVALGALVPQGRPPAVDGGGGGGKKRRNGGARVASMAPTPRELPLPGASPQRFTTCGPGGGGGGGGGALRHTAAIADDDDVEEEEVVEEVTTTTKVIKRTTKRRVTRHGKSVGEQDITVEQEDSHERGSSQRGSSQQREPSASVVARPRMANTFHV